MTQVTLGAAHLSAVTLPLHNVTRCSLAAPGRRSAIPATEIGFDVGVGTSSSGSGSDANSRGWLSVASFAGFSARARELAVGLAKRRVTRMPSAAQTRSACNGGVTAM